MTAINNSNEKITVPEETGGLYDENIPPEYVLSADVLQDMNNESNGAGNFAAHLTRKFFPELFGPGNLSFMYNWFCNGKLKKCALDSVRK